MLIDILTYMYSWIVPACIGNRRILLCICPFIIWIFLDVLGIVGPKKYRGVFEIPGLPIVGNYFQVRNNPALKYIQWQEMYEKNIFQIRIGNKRIIVVNSFEGVADIWKKSSVNSRPIQYTFHKIVSSTKGFTIGTTPWSQSYKRRKQVISQALNNKNLKNLLQILEAESKYTIKQIIKHHKEFQYQPSTNPTLRFPDIGLLQYLQYFTLRTSILITYGFRLDCFGKDKKLCDKIIFYENQIIKFRSPISNLDDYFPALRVLNTLFNWKTSLSVNSRVERDKYLDILYNKFNAHLEAHHRDGQLLGANDSFFQGNLISQYYLTDNHKNIEYDELQSICLTMISAGLDNTPLNLDHLLGQLSFHPHGQKYQELAINELLNAYQGNLKQCWSKVAVEMNCQFIIALIKETLRYFTVLPLSLPRVTTKDIAYNGITIPENSTLFMNAFAANHDEKVFKEPYKFNPHRWLDKHGKLKSENLIGHFAFGKGVRMCSGNILAFKEMYILVCRLLLFFKVKPPRDKSLKMISNPFESNENPKATSFDPKKFRVQLIPRILPGSDDLFNYVFKH